MAVAAFEVAPEALLPRRSSQHLTVPFSVSASSLEIHKSRLQSEEDPALQLNHLGDVQYVMCVLTVRRIPPLLLKTSLQYKRTLVVIIIHKMKICLSGHSNSIKMDQDN